MQPTEESKPSGTFNKSLRLLLYSIFFVGCLITGFFMYFKPSSSWFNGPLKSSDLGHYIHGVLSGKSKEMTTTTNETTMLVWLWPFGQTAKLDICSSAFNIEGCFITADRNFYNKSDGVVIHHRDIAHDLSNLPKLQRPLFQKWIWMNMESPSNSPKLPGMNNLFNLTISYRRDSDIQGCYGYVEPADSLEDFVPPSKNKLVCWIVSNWNPGLARVKYYNELQKHIKIETYGRAFGKFMSNDDYMPIMSSCKFYLSFENSMHKDYITEKLYVPLRVGTVPVVFGTTRQDYENFIPKDAFIHVDDFKSPKELADHLLLLDKNKELYLGYFKWRQHFKARTVQTWVESTCQACVYLKRHKGYRAFSNLNDWFWS